MTKSHSARLPAHRVLDRVIEQNGLKNDAALARHLKVAPPVISKLRHQKITCGPSLVLRMHEKLNAPLTLIRQFVPA
jgi:plasmid maintenance system antidote protein VapI